MVSFQQCQEAFDKENQDTGQNSRTQSSLRSVRLFAQYCTSRFINSHNALITALATGLLTAVTIGLLWLGREQSQTTRAQLRAYVFAENAGLFEGKMMNPPQPTHINEPGIVLVWRNSGQTPASKVVCWRKIEISKIAEADRSPVRGKIQQYAWGWRSG